MNRLLMFTLFFLLLIFYSAFAQPDSLWTHSFDLGANDNARAVAMTNDGGIMLAGFTTNPARGDSGIGWLLKLDSHGDSLWFRELLPFARINAMIILSDGSLAICGRNEGFQAIIARTDSLGNILWSDIRNAQAEYNHLCKTQDGGFACCGYRWVDSTPRQDAWVVKFNSAGAFLWQWQSNLTGWDEAAKITQATNGDLMIAGSTVRTPNAAILIRLSTNGVYRWRDEFPPAANTFIHSTDLIADTAAGCYIATSHEQADGAAGFKLERFSSNRFAIWGADRFIADTRFDLRELLQLPDGDFVTCGMMEDTIRDIFLERRHDQNNPIWSLGFHLENSEVYSIALTSDSGFVIAGTQFTAQNDANIFVLRLATLPPVYNLKIHRTGSSSDISLSWNAISGAVSYNIYRSVDPLFEPAPENLIANTTSTQFDDVGVVNLSPTQYFYIIAAIR